MAQINVVAPSGAVVSIPEEQLAAAQARGYRLEAQDEGLARTREEDFGSRNVAAAGAGFARGATFGLSDAALTSTGLVDPSTLAGLREANPVVSGISEVAGAIAPVLLPGGQLTAAGASARLGANVAGRVGVATGSRVLGTAAAGVVEGALYGVGSAISEAAIQNTNLTGEQMAGSVAFNALSGGVGGAGAGLFEKLLSRAMGRAAGEVGEAAIPGVAGAVDDVAPGPSALAVADEVLPAGVLPDGTPGARPPRPGAAPDAPGGPTVVDAEARPIGVQLEDMAGFAGDPNADKKLTGLVQKNAERIKGMMESFGLTMPTPEELVLKDLDYKKRAAGLLREKGLADEAPRLLLDDARYASAKTGEQKIALLETKQGEYLREFTGALDDLDALGGNTAVNVLDVAATIDEQVLTRLRQTKNLNKSAIAKVEGLFEDMLSKGETVTMKEAESLKRQIDPYLRWDSPLKDDNVALGALRDARAVLNRRIAEAAEEIAGTMETPDLARRFTQGKRNYGAVTELLEEGESRLTDARIANRVFSLTDNIAGAATGAAGLMMGGPLGIGLAATSALVNKWTRERLPHVLAVNLHRLRQSSAARRASVGLHRAISSRLDDVARALPEGSIARALPEGPPPGAVGALVPGAPPSPGAPTGALARYVQTGEGPFGAYSETLRRASAQGPDALWAIHAALWGADEAYRRTMTEAGVASDASESPARRRNAGLDVLEDATAKANSRADSALDAMLAGKRRGPRPGRLQGDDWRVLSERLLELAGRPDLLSERLAQSTVTLGEVAPEASAAAIAAAQRGVTYLAAAAPKPPPNPLDVPALGRTWSPSEQARASFERKLSAVQDPYSVLEDMAGGTVTRDAVDALRTVYPALYEDARQRILDRLASHGQPLPYAQRLSLGLLLGAPLDASMEPGMLQMLQASYQQQEPKQRPRFGGGGGPSEMAASSMTATERLMSRRGA